MQKACANPWCSQPFEVTAEDLAFYDKVSPIFGGKKYLIPPPLQCPECRQQRRLTWRNERSLYRRKCDATGKEIISMYPAGTPFPVYESSAWWGETWNALDHGRAFDFNRPFFEQFGELMNVVPKIALMLKNCENCEYNNDLGSCKNCYMCAATYYAEDSLYCYWLGGGRDCIDCSFSIQNELCYECLDSQECYNCSYLENCRATRDSAFLFDCRGCKDCFCCTGLRNKQYYFQNKPLSKEEYTKKIHDAAPSQHANMLRWQKEFVALKMKQSRECLHIQLSENCTGDYINGCKNCSNCFDVIQGQDFAYCYDVGLGSDFMDMTQGGEGALLYEVQSTSGNASAFCTMAWSAQNSLYCDGCSDSKDCFGCVSLRKNQYCILNKQYTKEEYEKIVPKIIEHMRKTSEWGEFFPESRSPFAYNETTAQQYYPLKKEDVTKRGWKWKPETHDALEVEKVIPARELPDTVDEIPDDILHWAITCEATSKPFRITKQELGFYRKMHLPIPHLHPEERHKRRMGLRNPRKLWNRTCANCQKPIATSYSPERPEKVVCEECYLKEVY